MLTSLPSKMRPEHDEHPPVDSDEPSMESGRLILAGLFFALSIFTVMPNLDLMVAAHYYSAERGFFHAHDPFVMALYNWTPWLGRGLILVLGILALTAPLASKLFRRSGRSDLAAKAVGAWRHLAIVSVCCALLGNGLVIEGVLKNTMGRPRPVHVTQFGGSDAYQRPFSIGPSPSTRRSFVTSHGAAGFALMSLGLTCRQVWRRRWLLIGAVAGGIIGWGRMMQGGHFLSDVIFAFYAVWLSCELIVWLDKRRGAKQANTPPPGSL